MLEKVKKPIRILGRTLLIVWLLWTVCCLLLGLLGNLLPENWQSPFVLRHNPLWSFGCLVIFTVAYWLSRRHLLSYFGWAALGTAIASGVAVAARVLLSEDSIWSATLKSFGWPYPWRELFVVGVLCALLVQLAVAIYFNQKGYASSATFGNIIGVLVLIMPYALAFCVTLALIGIERYKAHIWISVVYLALICLWDFCVWKWSKPNANAFHHTLYRTRCRQMLVHVDGVIFGIVLFWVLLLPFIIHDEQAVFTFISEISIAQATSPNSPLDIKSLTKHDLEEPLMAGVIGFATILSMVLLVVHFGEWEREESARSAPDSEVIEGVDQL